MADFAQSHLATQRAFVAESKLLGGKALRGLMAARGAFDEEPDLGKPDFQQPGTEPFFPRAQNRGDRQCRVQAIDRPIPTDQRQHIGGTTGGNQPYALSITARNLDIFGDHDNRA